MTTSPNSHEAPRQLARPSPLACLECRRKHLKCDGVAPTCGRCRKSQTVCHYTPSRRGYRSGSKAQQPTQASAPAAPEPVAAVPNFSVYGSPNANDFLQLSACPGLGPSCTPQTNPTQVQVSEKSGLTALDGAASLNPDVLSIPENQPSYNNEDDHLLDFYYAFFHEAHPILPPAHLIRRLAPLPRSLTAVLRFIGAHYAPNTSPDLYRLAAVSALSAGDEQSFYQVQALVLFSIALHARNERPESVEFFSKAADLALKLGMNHKRYAQVAGGGDPVKIESIRRTWWELYILDPMFSSFDQTCITFANDTVMDVPFPCDDASYATGMYISAPVTATQFYDRIFADDETEYPSYCYAIEAARIFRRILCLPHSYDDQIDDQIESLDASIGSWLRHVPESKTHVLSANGAVDQNMFRAYMIIHCASIYLHLPRSNLLSTPVASASITCAMQGPCAPPASASTHLVHATKAVKAANSLATLATLRSSSVIKHTPFFICALVLSAVVQLCTCSIRAELSVEPRRDRIALIIGELKTLNHTWAIARRVMQQIKAVAREVLEIGVRPRSSLAAIEDRGPDISAMISSDMWLGDIPMT
ncbi:hypothetical protein VTO42DRAFT_3643 [Malbranchea cinnamomea]